MAIPNCLDSGLASSTSLATLELPFSPDEAASIGDRENRDDSRARREADWSTDEEAIEGGEEMGFCSGVGIDVLVDGVWREGEGEVVVLSLSWGLRPAFREVRRWGVGNVIEGR